MKFKINKDLIYFTIIVALIAALAQLYFSFHIEPAWQQAESRKVEVYYNRDVEANKLVVDEIMRADKFVYFSIYTFTRTDIKDALLGAKLRGLDVQGVMDIKQTNQIDEQKKIYKELQAAGIPIAFQDHSAIMHTKVLVTDKSYVSGSFNWTSSATNLNDEVLEVGQDESIRKQYEHIIKEIFRRYPPKISGETK
jgi:phosphatidylserine/phosphatidylglycerophosphate/cardiolipin synthase-like enzyme